MACRATMSPSYPTNVTADSIPDQAFLGCGSLRCCCTSTSHTHIPSIHHALITSLAQPLRPLRHRRSVTFVEGVRLIGDEAFRGSQLTEVTLPPSLERVGRYAFAFSRVATTTFVPGASGAYVGAYAFRQCPVARTSVSVLASMPPSIAGRFSRLAFYYEDGRRRSRARRCGAAK